VSPSLLAKEVSGRRQQHREHAEDRRIDWHRLRASVACFIDWLRIAKKNGWLSAKVRQAKAKGVRSLPKTQRAPQRALRKRRTIAGLDMPYGQAAVRLGRGEETLPSDRPPPTRMERARSRR
jgi:hypothetical protein